MGAWRARRVPLQPPPKTNLKPEHPTLIIGRGKWLSSLQGMTPSHAVIPELEHVVSSGDGRQQDEASRVLQSFVSRVQRIKRSKKVRAKQRLQNRPVIKAPGRDGKGGGEVQESFAMQGSAFCYNGNAKANEDCELLILSIKVKPTHKALDLKPPTRNTRLYTL